MAVTFVSFLVNFRAKFDVTQLPQYKGNLFRSLLGAQMTRHLCGIDGTHVDHGSPLCAFERLFQGRVEKVNKYFNMLPPFIIDCVDERSEIPAGDILQVRFIVAAPEQWWPHVIPVWKAMGLFLGKLNNVFILQNVIVENTLSGKAECIAWYPTHARTLKVMPSLPPTCVMTYEQMLAKAEALPSDELFIRFLTPCRLEKETGLIRQPTFAELMFYMRRRAWMLESAHGDGNADWKSTGIGYAAEAIEANWNIEWVERERKNASGRSMDTSGFVGSVTLRGDLKLLLPLFVFVSVTHVGAWTTIGNGRIKLERVRKRKLPEEAAAEVDQIEKT